MTIAIEQLQKIFQTGGRVDDVEFLGCILKKTECGHSRVQLKTVPKKELALTGVIKKVLIFSPVTQFYGIFPGTNINIFIRVNTFLQQ